MTKNLSGLIQDRGVIQGVPLANGLAVGSRRLPRHDFRLNPPAQKGK
jgi:hypothetical protein